MQMLYRKARFWLLVSLKLMVVIVLVQLLVGPYFAGQKPGHYPKQHSTIVNFLERKIRKLNPWSNSALLARIIVYESERFGLDPFLVGAVISAESQFKERAVSTKGARGLMQLMPATAREVSRDEGLWWWGPHTLNDPNRNIRLGVRYLDYLLERSKGDRFTALVAYNWGPGNVRRSVLSKGSFLPAASAYARKVLKTCESWKSEHQRTISVGV